MEIRVLRYFLAIAREGSITNAASFLHVTQPTLSRQIRDLEEELGQKLFNRGSHNMTLTAEGMILRKRAEEIISMVDKTEAEFSSMENVVGGDIYIGGGETDAIKLVARVACELRTTYPGIHYHLYSGNSEDVTERLDKGLLDFGVLIQPADLSRYQSLQLKGKDQWGVLMPKDSPLAAKKAIKKEDLLDLPLICSRQAIRRHINGNEFSHWFGEDFERLNIVSTFNLIYNAALLVEAGAGYAISLDGLTDTSRDSALCFRPLSPRLESRLAIVWKKDQVFSPAAQLFLDRITDLYQSGSTDS